MIDTRNSRLDEIDHSAFNLREAYISDTAEYVAALRDEALFSTWGVKVLIRIPVDDFGELNENNVDEYSNFVDIQWEDTTELVIPLFKEYRQNQSENGMTADGTDGLYPLEVLLPTKLHLPRNSRIIFSEYNSREEKIAREWTVLGTQMKQLSDSKTYSRVANCVPSRQTTFDSLSSAYLGTIWFDWVLGQIAKERLRAHGIIWFHKRYLPITGLIKKYDLGNIQEVPENERIYFETIALEQEYLNESGYIVESHDGFKAGDIVPLYIEEDGRYSPVMIAIDESGPSVQMTLKVLEVDSTGKITNYILSPHSGYSKLNDDNILYAVGISDRGIKVVLQLVAVEKGIQEIQEVIGEQVITDTPKYITPYCMETRFVAKKLAISVLNW